MKRIGIFSLVVISVLLLSGCRAKEVVIVDDMLEAEMIDDNYRVYYEIMVGSFSDDSGDGMGDFRGLTNRLDYLNDGDPNSGKSLGITGLWLMPIMPSPSYHKYDTTNYKAIDPQYGTMEDFDAFIEDASARGIDVIIDFVINHTSSQHPWFKEARQAMRDGDLDNHYIDYYVLVKEDEQLPGRTYYHFAGEYYYEGNFWSEMPELNVENPKVREEIVDIAQFWLDKGVKGFRLDAVKYPHFNEHEKNIAFWNWFMDEVTAIREDAYVVGEMWDSDSNIFPYYEPFNNFDFGMSQSNGMIALTSRGVEPVNSYVAYLNHYKRQVKEVRDDAILQPFISNHDMDRAAGYLSVNDYTMHMAANLYILTYGTPFLYYGEEIGMRGSRGQANTDANRRLGMLWGDRDSVKDPIGSNYDSDNQVNGTVKDQLSDEDSLYNHYKELIMLRHANPEIARGDYTPIEFTGYTVFGGFLSTYQGSTVGVFHNISDRDIEVDLSLFTDYSFSEIRGFVGAGTVVLNGQTLTIEGKTSVVLK